MTELQALQLLDMSFSPSMVWQKYKEWPPERRDDMVSALRRVHPEGGLASIIQRAYDSAEERVRRVSAHQGYSHTTLPDSDTKSESPISRQDGTERVSFWQGFFLGAALSSIFVGAVIIFIR